MIIKEDIFFSIHWLKIYSGFSFQRYDLVIRDTTNMLRLKNRECTWTSFILTLMQLKKPH